MKKSFHKLIVWCLVVVMTALSVAVFSTSAATASQLRSEIAKLEQQSKNIDKQISGLKGEKAEKQKIVNAYQGKINNVRQQINLCNNEVAKIRAKVSANQAEINRKNAEISENMLTFKKRLRVSYMNGTYNSSLVMLGNSDFSNYLELEELTTSVASHDRQLIEKIVAEIKVLEAKKAENEKLLKDQVAIQNQLVAKQQELKSAQNEVQQLINSADDKMDDLSDQQADIQAQIKKDRKALEEKIRTAQPVVNRTMNASGFIWPVPGHYGITQHFGNNGHTGMDIADGGIGGKPIVAIADGVVRSDYYKSGWTSADGKWGLNSYGNYVVVDHGTFNGSNYSSWYAHMASVAVSPGQTVKQGQVLGYVGNTGNVYGRTGIHLHLSIKKNGSWVNPYSYVG